MATLVRDWSRAGDPHLYSGPDPGRPRRSDHCKDFQCVCTFSSVHIGARLGKLTVTKVSNNFWWFCMFDFSRSVVKKVKRKRKSVYYNVSLCVFLTKLQGMIKTWIKDGSPPFPCWSQLVEAVAASYGGQNPALAAELAKEHSTGRYW